MFIVYLTIYDGDKLPPYYIGSTSIEKYEAGYTGSVKSLKYGDAYYSEKDTNPNSFDTIILETTDTRKHALELELFWQKRVGAVKSSEYFNQSYAIKDGFCGMDTSGENNPRFNKYPPSKGKILANNGITTIWLNPSDLIPEGYTKGAIRNDKVFYNDGVKNYYIVPGTEDPSWHRGIIRRDMDRNSGKKFYNDGKTTLMAYPGEEPVGFVEGMLSDFDKGKRNYNDGIKNYFCSARYANNLGLVEGKLELPKRKYIKGRKRYNDGVKNIMCLPELAKKMCYNEGHINVKSYAKGTSWYNDGVNSFMLHVDDVKPHHVKGRLKK